MVEVVNSLIDKLEERIDVLPYSVEREIKDFTFFNNEEMPLPYEAHYTIQNLEDATKVFWKYIFSYSEMNDINKALDKWNIVSLTIKVKELVTEKEEKQEAIFDKVETEVVENPIEEEVVEKPKKEKKKKTTKKRNKWE